MLRGVWATGFIVALGMSSQVLATPRTLYIQPIQVCDDAGTSCAPMDSLDLGVLNKIFAQADTVVGIAGPTKKLNRSDYLEVSAVEKSASPTDEIRDLLRGAHLPALGLSASSSTINVFFVNEIREVTLSGADSKIGAGVVGFGFINANGVVIDKGARLDTLAHEIGHNLGLDHFSATVSTKNLMTDGAFRVVPKVIGDITPTGALTDQLTAVQITQIRNPIFTLNLAQVEGAADALTTKVDCPGNLNCIYYSFAPSATKEKLQRIQLNFPKGTDVTGVIARIVGTGTLLPAMTKTVLADGTVQVTLDLSGLPDGGLSAGAELLTATSKSDRSARSVDPLSVFFKFTGGTLSSVVYDATVPFDSASETAIVTFEPTPTIPAPVAEVPVEIPVVSTIGSIEASEEFFLTAPPELIAELIAEGVFEIGHAHDDDPPGSVPVPGSLVLLATMLAPALWRRRR